MGVGFCNWPGLFHQKLRLWSWHQDLFVDFKRKTKKFPFLGKIRQWHTLETSGKQAFKSLAMCGLQKRMIMGQDALSSSSPTQSLKDTQPQALRR